MDPISVTGTSIAVVQILGRAIWLGRGCVEEIRNAVEDAADLIIRMSTAMDRAEALERLIFRQAPQESLNNLSMHEQLDIKTQLNIIAMLQQYHGIVIVRYRALQQIYQLSIPSEENAAIASYSENKMRRLAWVFGGKRRFRVTVEACEKLNQRLFEIVQLYMMDKSLVLLGDPSATSSSMPPALVQLQQDRDVQYLELDKGLELIRITSGSQLMPDTIMANLEISQAIIVDRIPSILTNRGISTYLNNQVLVEFKSFAPSGQDYHELTRARPSDAAFKRIQQLVLLLNKPHSEQLRLLHCLGFYRVPESFKYGFILQYPHGCTHHKPKSLLDLLNTDYEKQVKLKIEPAMPLEHRLELALNVAASLFELHAVRWVHKSLQSDNILFFLENDQEENHKQEILESPWLVGFEYAREEAAESETPVDPSVDLTRDVYKHPDRWGIPTTKFSRQHDIYSLGVILLEIGLWRSAKTLGFQKVVYKERQQVQTRLLKYAKQRLPFRVGSMYASVVEKCLTGNFETGIYESQVTEDMYRDQVLGPLRQLLATPEDKQIQEF